MRNLYIVIYIFISLIFNNCSDSQLSSFSDDPVFDLIIEDHSNGYSYPDYGYFYKYNISKYNQRVGSILDTLKMLYDIGVPVENSWNRSYLNGCSPPGSDYTTTAIYSEVFIIHVSNMDTLLNKHNFFKIEQPYPISCGYSIRR